jgi:hypothetical protein
LAVVLLLLLLVRGRETQEDVSATATRARRLHPPVAPESSALLSRLLRSAELARRINACSSHVACARLRAPELAVDTKTTALLQKSSRQLDRVFGSDSFRQHSPSIANGRGVFRRLSQAMALPNFNAAFGIR